MEKTLFCSKNYYKWVCFKLLFKKVNIWKSFILIPSFCGGKSKT